MIRKSLAGCAVALVAVCGHAQPSDDGLSGLWSYRTDVTPELRGPLTLSRQGSVWRAAIAGRQARLAAPATGELRLPFAQGQGELRGRLSPDRREFRGFWVQPAAEPVGSGMGYATPLILRLSGGAWRGDVRPLPRTFTLYLKISREADGSLVGAFRNPESNTIGGRTQFLVSRSGEAVTFTTRPAEGRKPIVLSGALVGGHLRMAFPSAHAPVEMSRPSPAEAAAFYPRPPGSPAYAYRAPLPRNDGWTTASAAEVGMDQAMLAGIVRAQAASNPASARPPLMHSILVARHGKLVLEEYFFGFGPDTLHDTRSAAKTFSSVMLGAVMMHDKAFGPQSRIYRVMAARGPFANPDPRKAQITLAHLMTHTSGLACDDNDDASPGGEETMQSQTLQPDWLKYTLDLPMAHDPGTHYAYCSANSNLVGGALSAHTGVWLPELFERTVARPLQFGPYAWNLTPTGDGYAGGGAYLRPRDLLKVGQVFLDGGVWHGRRIVSADWVKVSTAPHVQINPETTGLTGEKFAESYIPGADGLAWHLNTLKVAGRSWREYGATGNGGQYLIVVPEADLAVVITAGNYGQGGIWLPWRNQIVGQQILAAIR